MPSTLGIVASGRDVLNDAVFWVDAGLSSVSSGALTNLGTGGSALNAQFGSTSGTDSFDPQLLTHTGTNHLYLPAVNGNYASTPSSAALNITGDIEVVVRVAVDAVGTFNGLVANQTTATSGGYWWYLQNPGALTFRWSTGTGETFRSSGNTLTGAGLVYGNTYWLKATLDVDNGAGGHQVSFYWAPDSATEPTSWTSFVQPAAGVGVTSIGPSASALAIGAFAAGTSCFQGKMYRAIVRNGIGGSTVLDADFTTGITTGAQTTFTESSANAATVTINRATSGRKSVAVVRNVLSFGTDDYLEVADSDLLDFAASDSFTVMAVVRQWATPTSFGRIIDKMSGAPSTGWTMLNNSTGLNRYLSIADGTVTVNAGTTNAYTAGVLTVTSAVRNVVTDNITLRNGNTGPAATNDTTTASLANANVMRIGSAATGGAYQDMELVAAAVWRRALNTNEIATLTARYT